MTDRGIREAERAMGTSDAFDAIYDAEFDSIHRFTTSRLGRSDGEEVTADVFHAAALAFADGRGHQVTGAWLMAVARNKVIDRWRRSERRRARAHLIWISERDAVDPFPDHWSSAATRGDVLAALDDLPRRYRTLLIAHYVEEMTVAEIVDALGGSVRSIESALARARRAFRAAYRQHGDAM